MNLIRTGDLEMAVCDRGSGPVVLLAHGFPFDHTTWQPQIDELSDVFRVIVPDLRGFGATAASDEVVTMEQMADDLAGLLDALGIDEPVHLGGLSMGGYIAWQFWRRHGDRLRSLLLCDTRAAADTPEAAAGRQKMAEHVLRFGTQGVAEMMLPKLFAQNTLQSRRELVESVQQVIARSNPRAIAAAQRGMAARPDLTAALGEINLPALVVVGEHDMISPPDEMRAIAAALPQAELLLVPDAGHLAPLERPDVVNPALRDFLNR